MRIAASFVQSLALTEWIQWPESPAPGAAARAVVGDTAFDVTFREGNTEIFYIYMLLNTSAVNLRQMVI